MRQIKIETIDHNKQRYNTIGDWQFLSDENPEKDCVIIKVSKLGDWRMEFALAVHELVEAFLCLKDGISDEVVTKFDTDFEKLPYFTKHRNDSCEPGDYPSAPYQRQHCFATAIERMIIALLGVKWKEYEDKVEEVCKTYGSKIVSRKWRNSAGA